MNLRQLMTIGIALGLAATTAQTQSTSPDEATIVEDSAALDRLRANSGITLQWIGWDRRGHVAVTERDGLVHLSGEQREQAGPDRLTLDGDVLRIDGDSFAFRGRIMIADSPDVGRLCERDGDFEFFVTQNRRYWRLQEMEVCDGLTDYVDIYF